MPTHELSRFDLSPYQSVPQLNAEGTYQLGVALVEAKPADAPALVEQRVAHVQTACERLREALVAKLDAARGLGRREVDFDGLADRLWSAGRAELEARMLWAEPGVASFSAAEAEELELERRRADAELARELSEHLFAEGVAFACRPFPEQAAAMASRLDFLARGPKADRYAALFGVDRLAALRVVQRRYEAMVHDRATRDGAREDVGALRHALQRQIGLYVGTVLALLDESDPSSVATVRAALQPIVHARLRKGGATSGQAQASVADAALSTDSP